MDYAHGRERFTVFVHSKATAEQDQRGTWRQPRTSRLLQPGEAFANRFAFRWADSYEDVRELLCQNGGVDVQVAPGMVVPRDLTAPAGAAHHAEDRGRRAGVPRGHARWNTSASAARTRTSTG